MRLASLFSAGNVLVATRGAYGATHDVVLEPAQSSCTVNCRSPRGICGQGVSDSCSVAEQSALRQCLRAGETTISCGVVGGG